MVVFQVPIPRTFSIWLFPVRKNCFFFHIIALFIMSMDLCILILFTVYYMTVIINFQVWNFSYFNKLEVF